MSKSITDRNSKLLSENNIRLNILPHYGMHDGSVEQIKFKDSKKQRAVYKVTDKDNVSYSLKKVFYGAGELLFIYSAVQWWFQKGVNVPTFTPTVNGGRFVSYEKMLFIMTPWIDGDKLNYDSIDDFSLSGENLGFMHKTGADFSPITGSARKSSTSNSSKSIIKRTTSLVNCFNTSNEIDDDFSNCYKNSFEQVFNLAETAYRISSKINYSNLTYSLCHMDYVNKNIIFDRNKKLWVIDFDNCRQTYVANDICHALRRYLKRSSTLWDYDLFRIWMEKYTKEFSLNKDDLMLIFMNLIFPQRIWKVSRDYYRNIKKCSKSAFTKILNDSLKHVPKKIEFANILESHMDLLLSEFSNSPKFYVDFDYD